MNPDTNPLVLFLRELFFRFKTKSPKFFKVWQIITGALMLITGVPGVLELLTIPVPDVWNAVMQKTIAKVAAGMFFMSLISTQSKTIGVTKDGQAVKQTNPNLLPFTSMLENKIAASQPVISTEVIEKVAEQEKKNDE